MNWNGLYGINAVTGKAIDIPTLAGPGADHDRYEGIGVPNGAILTVMMNATDALCPAEAPRTGRDDASGGISFHIVQYVPDGAPLTITSQFTGQKTGSAMRYENTLFNDVLAGCINVIVGNIIVHQSIAPCTRCHVGYRQLVQNGPHTIAVFGDDGHDGAPGNTIFLFASIGLVSYRR